MSIADKLKSLKEAKQAIRDAIIKKGIEVLDTDSFKSYADKIESIVSGGGSGEVVSKTQNIKGLCFWIDGQHNTRAGLDHSIGYMENLMWNVPASETGTGNAEVFGGDSVWNGDYLKLTNYAFYPQVASPQVTVEMLFYIDDDVDTVTNGMYFLCSRLSSKGWSIQLGSESGGRTFFITGMDADKYLPARERNKPYYVVATFDTENNYCKLAVLNTGEVAECEHTTLGTTTLFNLGLGIAANTGTGATSSTKNRWVGLNIGMAKIWTRLLSDDEIQENYQEVKARFGF